MELPAAAQTASILADTDSLDSVTIPLPHLVLPDETPPSRTGPRAAPPCDLLTVPIAAAASGVSLTTASDSEEDEADLQQARPRTVLSAFRHSVGRPLSSLSTRARSALSNTGQHLHDIPSNVRGVLQRWVRARRRRRVAPTSGVSTPDSLDIRCEEKHILESSATITFSLSLSLSADSGASGRVRKQLDSLAASSEYGIDDDSTAPPTGAMSRVTRPLRRLYRRVQRSASCHPSCRYIVDPKGD